MGEMSHVSVNCKASMIGYYNVHFDCPLCGATSIVHCECP